VHIKGYLGLGSNMGDRLLNLHRALCSMQSHGINVVRMSSIYETLPVDCPLPQPNYLNMVVMIETGLEPLDLLRECKGIERSLGRERSYKNAPRIIDIDVLLLNGIMLDTPELKVPHPHLESRAFVIHPLAEISPDLVLPSGKAVADVKKNVKKDEILAMWKVRDEGFRECEENSYHS